MVVVASSILTTIRKENDDSWSFAPYYYFYCLFDNGNALAVRVALMTGKSSDTSLYLS